MENIQKRTVKRLEKLNSDYNTESVMYHDDDYAYKIFQSKEFSYEQLLNKREKIKILGNGTDIDKVLLPKVEVLEGHFVVGYGMDYVKCAQTLYDYYEKINNLSELLNIVYQISLSLREIHNDPRNIVVSDLHFGNIIVDNNKNFYFCDFDSCKVDGLQNDCIPRVLWNYMYSKGIKYIDTNTNTDKFALILSLFQMLMDKFSFDYYNDYYKHIDKIKTLQKMKEIWDVIHNARYKWFEVPYVDELIDEEDLHNNVLCLK